MAYGCKEVSRQRPCPVCGKPDYCSFFPAKDFGELLVCKRANGIYQVGENIMGKDGNFYIFSGKSRSGNFVYEEANQKRQKELQQGSSKERTFSENKSPQPKTLTPIDIIQPKSDDELDKIYRCILKHLVLEERDRDYLYQDGWTDEMIEKYQVVSFPAKDFLRFKYQKDYLSKNPYRKKLAKLVMNELGLDDLKGVPGAYKDKSGNWTFTGNSGILFPVMNVNHKVYRLRLRFDFRDVETDVQDWNTSKPYFYDIYQNKIYISWSGYYKLEDGQKCNQKEIQLSIEGRVTKINIKGKYRNFSSFHADEKEEKKGFLVNVYDSGCEAGNQLAFYYHEQRDDMFMFYVIEGEKKGIYSNEKLRAPVISVPGVSSWSLLFQGKKGNRMIDTLIQNGAKIFVVAYDADKEINKHVLAAQQNVVEALKQEGIIVGICNWDSSNGKGLDDLLKNGYKPSYEPV